MVPREVGPEEKGAGQTCMTVFDVVSTYAQDQPWPSIFFCRCYLAQIRSQLSAILVLIVRFCHGYQSI